MIKSIGKKGTGPGEFDQPHALAIDSQGRLFVGDRGNNRDPDHRSGREVHRRVAAVQPAERHLHRQERHPSMSPIRNPARSTRTGTEWKRGIRIGSAKDGKVTAFIPIPTRTRRPARARPKASPSTPPATSTAPKWDPRRQEVRQEVVEQKLAGFRLRRKSDSSRARQAERDVLARIRSAADRDHDVLPAVEPCRSSASRSAARE